MNSDRFTFSNRKTKVLCIGAGPAGLTAAYKLCQNGLPVIVLEADPTYVGGISRTVNYKGFLFDIGGHRFFSKSQAVEDFWTEILQDEMLIRPRKSRIYYKSKFFDYPLKAQQALLNLGLIESALCVFSYLCSKIAPPKQIKSFEDWVCKHFGRRLFNMFFKTYTEKVWGMSCSSISADWAAQRVKGLSLSKAIFNSLFPSKQPKDKSKVVKSLIDSFRYPRKGPGQMWETVANKVKQMGGEIIMGSSAVQLTYLKDQGCWQVIYRHSDGSEGLIECEQIVSSLPLKKLVSITKPTLSASSYQAAKALKYRDFLTVALMLKQSKKKFDDNWIYIHDSKVRVGRIQNFKSWSPAMLPDQNMDCYGLEYFCFEGDGLWNSKDEELIDLAKREMSQIGLIDEEDVVDACVVRQPKAYPVYDDHYLQNVQLIKDELEKKFPSLHLVGRNGMHKYNNQDHAMMTAMLTVENVLAGKKIYDVWQVNQDAEYHELDENTGNNHSSGATSGLRYVPKLIK